MSNLSFEMKLDIEINEALNDQRSSVSTMVNKVKRLQDELKHCRNELCFQCGRHKDAHNGSCKGCRYACGGEWSRVLED